MPNLWIIFMTGLTTGGLSCLAVQGGLLANVIANQADDDTLPAKQKSAADLARLTKHELMNYYQSHQFEDRPSKSLRSDVTLSIALFLLAKIIAYTLLGFSLGYLGTMIQLTPVGRGILMLLITVFMIGTALRLLNVHPIFNYFQLQPPKFIRRFIRRISKNSREDFATPLFLGALTILIPCGVTQAMMALAIGTGSPLAGGLTMLVFTIGTTPLFFLLAYLTTRIGEKLNAYFTKMVAVLLIIFALYSLESGLNLVGSPVSYAAYKQWLSTPSQSVGQSGPAVPSAASTQDSQELTINALNNGYQPNYFRAKAGQPVKLILATENVYSCSRSFVIPSLNIQRVLPETGREIIELPAQPKGRLRFSCSMGMYTGQIAFE